MAIGSISDLSTLTSSVDFRQSVEFREQVDAFQSSLLDMKVDKSDPRIPVYKESLKAYLIGEVAA